MNLQVQESVRSASRTLCGHLARAKYDDLSSKAVHEARRGVLDWLGCALAGSRHATLDHLIDVLREVGSAEQATVLGRRLRLGLLDAPLANGQMGHVLDFDDTHMGGVVLHTSSPVLAALLAAAERGPTSGRSFIAAYAVGFEAGVRCGQAAPAHHAGGWHLTGTLGSIAAAVATGHLFGLNEEQLTCAMGIGATQAAGMQQNRGTMCKSFHAGKAASNGVLAGLLARRGFDSSQEIIEGKRGFCRIYSSLSEPEHLTRALGENWEIASNGHKPYACGVVLHPLIDALLKIRGTTEINPAAVEAVELRVHPHVLSVTGVVEPATGLQSKFSVYHSAAIALIDGAADIAQYSDQRALDAAVAALRRKVTVAGDEYFRKDQAWAKVTIRGTVHEAKVDHASGTIDNPMSDAAIDAKFRANAEPAIGRENTKRLAENVWKLDTLADVRELLRLAA